MSFSFKVGGTWQPLATGWMKVAGTWQQIKSGWIKVAGTWQQVYTSLSAAASDTTPSGADSGFSPLGTVSSNSTTITPNGGSPPYTFAWTQGPGGVASSGPYNVTAAASATTNWSKQVRDDDAISTENWTCTVTDDNAQTAAVVVAVTLTWLDLN